jgi:succinyl-diaminopimelate desuccinylase
MTMKNLLKELIRAEPTADNGELQAANVLADYLRSHGIDSSIDCWDNSRANLTARIKSTGQSPPLLFVAHLDVVPSGEAQWQYEPFEPVEEQGRIYGRGSADMKGGLVATAAAIVELVESGVELKGDIVLAALAGEETDSCGAGRFVECTDMPAPAGIIIPEPTKFDVVSAHRGMLWLKVETEGKTAHGSMPHLGINAIAKMNKLLNALDGYEIPHTPNPVLGSPSMSVNRISGGKATNVIPDRCTIEIDMRTLPQQQPETTIADLEKLFAELQQTDPDFKARISVIRTVEAMQTDTDTDFVKSFLDVTGIEKTIAVGYTTDAPHFVSMNAPILIFGPGDPDVCHKPDEYIETADIEKAKDLYKDIITKFLT